jgi:hypothetical protein
MTEPIDPPDIAAARAALADAWAQLAAALIANCRGPHGWSGAALPPGYYQRAWCPICRRTPEGELIPQAEQKTA